MKSIFKLFSNIPGWCTSRKIIVLESDDWGSIRVPSIECITRLASSGVDVYGGDVSVYNKYDTLASPQDLMALFDTLKSVKDKNDRHPVITAVSLVANPDFEKIASSKFTQYYWEPFTDTLKRYAYSEDSFKLWQQGIKEKLFIPQFHGREHLNIALWLRSLQEGDLPTRLAFEQGCWGFNNFSQYGISYQAAFDLEKHDDLILQESIIREGLDLFEKLFHYKATFFVPPNGLINNRLEEIAFAGGINYISTPKIQLEVLGKGKKRIKLHYIGQRNRWGQTYITRNCFFEPSYRGRDWVASCIKEIETAFYFRKPAVISTHRVNYIGALNEDNRIYGLAQLKLLMKTIIRKWPNVEFMTSNQLGDIITGRNMWSGNITES